MAITNLKTPGVYVQEISTLPASVAQVPTAIPAFIGYTERGPLNTPTRVTSLPEYQEAFGGAYGELLGVTLNLNGTITPQYSSVGTDPSPYTLFYHLQMYFANGGGPCYIVSVGTYDTITSPIIDKDEILDGLDMVEEVDEVTLLLVPELLNVDSGTPDADIKAVNDAMLAQCNKLKDRFTVMDVLQRGGTVNNDALQFRNVNVSANYLNYGATYYPYLDTLLNRSYSDDAVTITDNRSTPVYGTAPNNKLSTIFGGLGARQTLTVVTNPTLPADNVVIVVGGTSVTLSATLDFQPGALPDDTAKNIIAAINSHPVLSLVARAQYQGTAQLWVIARTGSSTISVACTPSSGWMTATGAVGGTSNSQDTGLYYSVKTSIGTINALTLPPAATMAGVYAAVDGDRGVWKAPANVSITNIIGPNISVTEAQQAGLNVDATSGKSINAIRTFTGRGTIVWGARTLEGNSNEWRYVPVRRLFIMAEESIKKATEFVVFEPNDANTWIRLKGMIGNFLNDLWKQGALAGSKPEQAYFVQVGLGETMTVQDILEGRCIITIGMAAVRPAEFIILQFMHKLQEA